MWVTLNSNPYEFSTHTNQRKKNGVVLDWSGQYQSMFSWLCCEGPCFIALFSKYTKQSYYCGNNEFMEPTLVFTMRSNVGHINVQLTLNLWLKTQHGLQYCFPKKLVWPTLIISMLIFHSHKQHYSRPLHTQAKSHDHDITRAQKKVSKGRPNTPPKSCSVVTDPQVQCEAMRDRGLNQMLFQ